MTWLLKSANHKVRFTNGLYHPSKQFYLTENKYAPKVLRMLLFFIIPIEMIYETNIVWYFFNVNVLTNSFCIKECLCTFLKLQILFFYFYMVWVVEFWIWHPHITQNVKYNLLLFCLGTIKFSFTQRYSISFPFIFHTFCPYLESLTCFNGNDLIVQSLYVHLKDRKAGWR